MFEGVAVWQLYLFFGVVFIFLITGGIIAFIVFDKYRWKFKVSVIENPTGNNWEVTRRDRARLIKFGDGGEEIYLLKRHKVYRIGYGKFFGRNHLAYAIDKSGYWYNIKLGDFDNTLKQIGIVPIDRDLRFASASLRKGIENRYNQKTFMEKYGVVIAFGMLFLCICALGVASYYNISKQKEIASLGVETMKLQKEVLEFQKTNIAEIKTSGGGSGIVPAT